MTSKPSTLRRPPDRDPGLPSSVPISGQTLAAAATGGSILGFFVGALMKAPVAAAVLPGACIVARKVESNSILNRRDG
jgi:hypothetical protein